jgi:acetyl esterase/lipase
MRNKLIVLFLRIVTLGVCFGQGSPCQGNPFFVTSVSYSCSEIPYGSNPKQKYDIYVPSGSDPKPVVIFIHGGGFVQGKKENIKNNY